MEMLAPIIVGLLLLVGLGMLFLARDVWRAYHITIAAFLILASTVAIYLAARTLQTHASHRKNVVDHEKAIASTSESIALARFGSKSPDPADPTTFGISQLDNLLEVELAGRGRVWDAGVANGFNASTGVVTIEFSGAAPQIPVNTTVFAFSRAELPNGAYMGEFIVTSVSGNTVLIAPALPLLERQAKRISGSRGPWVLFELMPPDTHEGFKGQTPDRLQALLPKASVGEFLRDGTPAQPNDPPERVWREVRFTKDYELTVGEVTTSFASGDTTIVNPAIAADLVSEGVAEEVAQVYVRQLRNYPLLMRETRQRIQVLDDAVRELTGEVARIQDSWDRVKLDISYRTEEIAKLEVERDKFNAELAAVQELVSLIEARHQEVLAEVNQVYQNNLAYVAELAKLQQLALEAADAEETATTAEPLAEIAAP